MQLHDFPGNAQTQAEMLFVLMGLVHTVVALKYLFFMSIQYAGAIIHEYGQYLAEAPGITFHLGQRRLRQP